MDIRHLICTLAVATLLGPLLAPQASAQPKPADLRERLDQWVSYMAENHRFNGAVLVVESGRVVLNRAVGQSNLSTGAPLSTTSLFNLSEASQPFTAVAVLQLKEQGKLSLDDELTTYLPELRAYSDITLRHLLTHTSGIPSYETPMAIHWDKSKVATNRDLIRILAAQAPALEFRPGSRHQQSATNYALLASVVERVSGRDFAVYCAEAIFAKAGMTKTYVYKGADDPARALPYRTYLLKPATLDDQSYLVGIVGDKNVLSSTDDLLQWELALQNNVLLRAATLSETTLPATLSLGATTGHGFAWALPTGLGRRVAEVAGQLGGYSVVQTRMLDEQHAIVVLSNTAFPKIFAMADGLYNILLGIDAREPKIPVGLAISSTYTKDGLTAALNRFNAIRNNSAQRSQFDIRESELNVLGHELLEMGKAKDAIEIFKLNTDVYPRSFNVYDSLGEALMADGQRDNAIANYKKSLLLYPDNVNAVNQLRILEKRSGTK